MTGKAEPQMTMPDTISSREIEERIIARGSTGVQALPMLDVIFSRLPADIVSAFKTRTGFLFEAELEAVSYGSWSRSLSSFDEFSVHAVAEAKPWGGTIILTMDPEFFYAAVETQLNGVPTPGNRLRRHPSTIERRMAQTMAGIMFGELSRNFARLTEVRFDIDGIENAQQISSQLGATTPIVASTMKVRVGECAGSITITVPLSTIEPVQPKLTKMFLGEKLGGDATWRDHITSRISGSSVMVDARLTEVDVPLQDILGWKVGSTIDLGIDAEQEATIICSGLPILHGYSGKKKNDRVAIRVTRDHGEEMPADA